MKLIFGISAFFLLTVIYLFNTAPSIQTSNELIQHSNPLKGAQTILANINQQTLDFTELDTPYSKDTLDTEIAGLIRTDENGNLIVKGEKWITLNQGDEFIRLTGIVRQNDITPENTVTSSRLADSRISYSGRGAVADSNAMGWGGRILNHWIWPF